MRRSLLAAMAIVLVTIPLFLTGCFKSDADVASQNISKAAEQFEVNRRIVAINGITDKYLIEVTGYCSVETTDSGLSGALEITCRDGANKFKKIFVGLSDNVSYTVEQLQDVDVSTTRMRVIFKPETIVPNFDRP